MLKRIFKRRCKSGQGSKKGSALIAVIILSLFLAVLAYFLSSQKLVQLKKIKYFQAVDGRDRIVEMFDQMMKDPSALMNSRVQIDGQDENNHLINCLYRGDNADGREEPNCTVGPSVHEPVWSPFVLFMAYPLNKAPERAIDGSYSVSEPDQKAQRFSGVFYTINGTACSEMLTEATDACPLFVKTEFIPQCRGSDKCEWAQALNIRLTVQWSAKEGISFFKFKDYSKEIYLTERFLNHLN